MSLPVVIHCAVSFFLKSEIESLEVCNRSFFVYFELRGVYVRLSD